MTDTTTAQTGTGDTAAATKEPVADTTVTTTPASDAAPGGGGGGTPAADAGKPAEPKPTIAGSDPVEKPVVAPADWPENWRDKMAESVKPGDKKFRERLERFASPADVGKSWLGAETKISSGEFRKELPKDAKPEEVAAYRTEHGIPETPEGYLEKLDLPQGMVLGEADKPVALDYAAFAHARNMTREQVSENIQWYYQLQDKANAARDEADDKYHTESDDSLRADWGPDYRRYINATSNIISTLPDQLDINNNGKVVKGGMLLAARTPDGRMLADNPHFVRWLANHSMELNPTATLIPNSGGEPGKSVDSELAEIRKYARENPDKYGADKAMQARQELLVTAQQKLQQRGKHAA